jgi:hypothetical protein
MSTPLEQIGSYVDDGYTRIEIDIYALSETTYKFCHPLDRERVDEIHDLDEDYLKDLVKAYPQVEWLVDLKCLDLGKAPLAMMQHIADSFGGSAVVVADQTEILEFMHDRGMRTCQYFRDGVQKEVNFIPNFFIQNPSDNVNHHSKTILFCSSLEQVSEQQDKNFAGLMVDGNLLEVN